MISKKKFMPRSHVSLLFVFGAVVGTLLLLAVIFSLGLGSYPVLETETIKVLSRNALPSNASGTINSLIVGFNAQPTTVYAYHQADGFYVGLVAWDRLRNRFQLKSNLRLEDDPAFLDVPTLTLLKTGWGFGQMIQLQGTVDQKQGIAAIELVQLTNDKLTSVSVERLNETKVEKFLIGPTLVGQADPTLEDLNGDGVMEFLEIVTSTAGKKKVEVFFWTGDRLGWSEEWSRAMTARASMFL